MRRSAIRYLVVLIPVIALGVWAAAITLPHTFNDGDVLQADALNQNFAALVDAVEGALTPPLTLSALGTKALEVQGQGSGVSNATLRSLNNGGGIPAWFEQTASGSSDTALGLKQSGTGPLVKAFGPNGGAEEVHIAGNGTIYLFKPGATNFNDFNIRLDNSNGVVTAATFSTSSDAALKGGFERVDGAALLDALASVEIGRWHFLDAPDVVHLGPTAQDFRAAFGLGADSRRISTVDADGVALAAIQALHRQNVELQERIEALEQRLAAADGTP